MKHHDDHSKPRPSSKVASMTRRAFVPREPTRHAVHTAPSSKYSPSVSSENDSATSVQKLAFESRLNARVNRAKYMTSMHAMVLQTRIKRSRKKRLPP